jgi:hypothetical protein
MPQHPRMLRWSLQCVLETLVVQFDAQQLAADEYVVAVR